MWQRQRPLQLERPRHHPWACKRCQAWDIPAFEAHLLLLRRPALLHLMYRTSEARRMRRLPLALGPNGALGLHPTLEPALAQAARSLALRALLEAQRHQCGMGSTAAMQAGIASRTLASC